MLTAPRGPARGEDDDETERRLKAAGIEPALRERIHESIRRGVRWLRERQAASGGFPSVPGSGAGPTALAGLALRHSAIPEGVDGGRAAIGWLRRRPDDEVRARTYEAGITAMLLTGDGSQGAWNREIHDRLRRGSSGGYWGYRSDAGDTTPNLSTSQFACLGLWAGERAGAPAAETAWRVHLGSLLAWQGGEGSWGYWAARTDPRNPAYATGTCMGLADLLLAERALDAWLHEEPRVRAQVLVAKGLARSVLPRHAREILGEGLDPRARFAIGYGYYALYALEKACVFLAVEDVGGLAWYRTGAERLLREQSPDGGWSGGPPPPGAAPGARPPSDVVQTSFALLFLLRSSEAYRPVTPSPVGTPGPAPSGDVTPGDAGDPAPPPAASTPSHPAPPLSPRLAGALLDRLEAWLAAPRPERLDDSLDALPVLRTTYGAYRPGRAPLSEAHDLWCRRLEDTLVSAATAFRRPGGGEERMALQAAALASLEVLGGIDARAAAGVLRAVDAQRIDADFPPRFARAWFAAALDALRRMDPPGLGPWLRERCLDPDPEGWPRTFAALSVLSVPRARPGAERHAMASAVMTRLRAVLERSDGAPEVGELHREMQAVLEALLRDPAAVGFPARPDPQALSAWWLAHRGADAGPWED